MSSPDPQHVFASGVNESPGGSYKEDVDPFELRLHLTSILTKISANQLTIHKAVYFLLKHRRYFEPLYECIIEELENEKTKLNKRMDILYMLDHLIQQIPSQMRSQSGYMQLLSRDFKKIMELAAPDTPAGQANVRNASQLLQQWKVRGFFPVQACDELIGNFEKRMTVSPNYDGIDQLFPRSEVIERMEEDRERHKRQKEDQWYHVEAAMTQSEFNREWDEVSDWNDHDEECLQEESRKFAQFLQEQAAQ